MSLFMASLFAPLVAAADNYDENSARRFNSGRRRPCPSSDVAFVTADRHRRWKTLHTTSGVWDKLNPNRVVVVFHTPGTLSTRV